jgi:hypothetical protein
MKRMGRSNAVNLDYANVFRIADADFSELLVFGPGRMNALLGFFFGEFDPLKKLPFHLLRGVIVVEFFVLGNRSALQDNRILICETMKSNVFGFIEVECKIDSRADSSRKRFFETIFNDEVCVLFLGPMIDSATFRTVPRKVVRVLILTNFTKVSAVLLWASWNFAAVHPILSKRISEKSTIDLNV